MTDLHCHILPGLDDGARTTFDTVDMMKDEISQGVKNVVLTPHFDPEQDDFEEFLIQRKAAWNRMRAHIDEVPELRDMKIRVGAEVFYSASLALQEGLDHLCFTNTPYLLLELPVGYRPQFFEETISKLRMQGYKIIIAHVERYKYLMDDLKSLYRLVENGCIIQVNCSSIIRGGETAKQVIKLIDWGLVHVISSDAHDMERRNPNMYEAALALSEQIGNKATKQILLNGNNIFENKPLDLPEPHCPRKTLTGKWR